MKNENRSFAENFKKCCLESRFCLAYEHQQNSEEFVARNRKCDELYKLIQQKLGKDGRLIDEFDNAKNLKLAFEGEFIYQQGFQDCVWLLHWMKLL